MRTLLRRFDLGKAIFVLPNLFTTSSIFCGMYAVARVSTATHGEHYYQAALAVFFGAFFDMADGRIARLTRTQSEFGVQLDSLADMVTFGVAPAAIVYRWGLSEYGLLGVGAVFVYCASGAIRLARFNVLAARGVSGGIYFIGLPIPAAAGCLVSLVMLHQRVFDSRLQQPMGIVVLLAILGYLMVSNVRYRNFKDLRPRPVVLLVAIGIITTEVALAVVYQPAFAVFAFFCAYLGLGLVEEVMRYGKRDRRVTDTSMGRENDGDGDDETREQDGADNSNDPDQAHA